MFNTMFTKIGTKTEGKSPSRASTFVHAVQAEACFVGAVLTAGSMLELVTKATYHAFDPLPPRYEISAPIMKQTQWRQTSDENMEKAPYPYDYPVTILITDSIKENGCKWPVSTAEQFARYKAKFPDTPNWSPPKFDVQKGYVVFDEPALEWSTKPEPQKVCPTTTIDEVTIPCKPVLTPEQWASLDAWEAKRQKKLNKKKSRRFFW